MSEITPQTIPENKPKKRRFIFGFHSVGDLSTTVFGKGLVAHFISAAFTWATLAAGIVYPDKTVVLILFLVMLFDWITGVYKAHKAGTFNSFTFQRMLLNMVLTFGLVAVTTQYAAAMWIFKLLHLNDVLMTGFMVTYLVSIIENLHEIDERLIPTKLYTYLKSLLNLDNVLKNYFKKESPKEPDTDEATETTSDTASVDANPMQNGENN